MNYNKICDFCKVSSIIEDRWNREYRIHCPECLLGTSFKYVVFFDNELNIKTYIKFVPAFNVLININYKEKSLSIYNQYKRILNLHIENIPQLDFDNEIIIFDKIVNQYKKYLSIS